jgi:hypothetical protein
MRNRWRNLSNGWRKNNPARGCAIPVPDFCVRDAEGYVRSTGANAQPGAARPGGTRPRDFKYTANELTYGSA